MLICLSPAKTFRIQDFTINQKPYFIEDAKLLNSKLKSRNIDDLMKSMHISNKVAIEVGNYINSFDQIHSSAIHTYYGYQYKSFDILSLEKKYHNNIKKHLYILSGYYGLLNAYDDISYYRLEMQDKSITNLYDFWQSKILSYIEKFHSNEPIINLASNEYGQVIKNLKQTITIDFYQHLNDTYKITSMEVKKIRGLFARALIINPSCDLKSIMIENYIYNKELSSNTHFIFIKEL